MRRLQLKVSKNLVNIKGMGGKVLTNSLGTVDIEIFPHFTTKESVKFSAIVSDKMKELLTTKNVKTKLRNVTEINKLTLADPTFYSSSNIEMILGVDIHAEILLQGQGIIKPQNTGLVLQSTILGWIVSGALEKQHKTNNVQCFTLAINEIEDKLKMFWDQNESDKKSKTLSVEDQACINFYKKTVNQ